MIDKPLSLLNIYPKDEEHPIEDFGISEDLLTSIYFDNKYNEYSATDIQIDIICDNQTGVIYNSGGYLTKYGFGQYALYFYTEDDASMYDYRLEFNFLNKTGKFIRGK